MKVLHINCNYLTTALHQTMIEHLEGQGVESTVFAPTYARENAVIAPNGNVVASECFRKRDRYFFHYKQKKLYRALQKKIDCTSYDCIHAYTLFTDGNCAMKLSRACGIPYVVAVRSTDVNVFFKYMVHLRGLGVSILRHASAVFFLSEPYRRQVMEQYVPARYRREIRKKTHIIGNGIDDFWLTHAAEPDISSRLSRIAGKELRLVYAGRVNANKNPLATQRAMELLRERGWRTHFTVVGKVEDRAVYEELRRGEDITYIRQQPKEKLLDIYRQNDIFVMPSHKETFGLVYAEAMSQGLAVLYTRGQGFDGQFPDGEAGYAIDDKEPADIADKIELAAQNYERLVRNGLRLVDQFDWTAICARYRAIYEELSKGRTTGRAL